jgi:hypothetical protein
LRGAEQSLRGVGVDRQQRGTNPQRSGVSVERDLADRRQVQHGGGVLTHDGGHLQLKRPDLRGGAGSQLPPDRGTHRRDQDQRHPAAEAPQHVGCGRSRPPRPEALVSVVDARFGRVTHLGSRAAVWA